MLETEKPDILDICLPTYLHVEYSLMALQMGINVVCEKPISLKREDVALVYGTAKKHNCKFMVEQVLRFWPEFSELKEIIETFGIPPELELERLDDQKGTQRYGAV